jgi:hypothetical protein
VKVPDTAPPQGWPLAECAARIGCCAKTLKREGKRGRLRVTRIGDKLFIREEHWNEYLALSEVPPSPEVVAYAAKKKVGSTLKTQPLKLPKSIKSKSKPVDGDKPSWWLDD